MKVLIFPSNKLPRLVNDFTIEKGHLADLKEGLEKKYKTEAVFALYTTQDEETYCLRDVSIAANPEIRILLHYIVIDLDRKPHEKWENLAEAADIQDLFDHELGCTSYISRAGIRLVFALSSTISWQSYKTTVENLNALFSMKYSRILKDFRLEIDESNREWHRLYKLPLIYLPKYKEQTYDYARILYHEEPFELKEIEELLTATSEDDDSFEQDDEEDVETTDYEQPTTVDITMEDKAKALLPIKRKLETYKKGSFDLICSGQAFFSAGTRNRMTFKVVNLITNELFKVLNVPVSPAIIYSILFASIMDTRGETPPGEALAETWQMIVNAHSRVSIQHKETIAKAEKLAEFKHGSGLPVLVVKNNTYFVYTKQHNYIITNNVNALPALLDQASVVTGAEVRNKKGTFLETKELIAAFAKHCNDVVYTMAPSAETTYHEDTAMLFVKARQPFNVEPEFSEEIDKWLYYLSGGDTNKDDYEALLDWLATFLLLDRPTCALYIEGKKGSGKGMLAASLAAFFGVSPVTLAEALSNFNEGLLSMPLIVQDEKAPAIQNLSNDLRSIIANSDHRIGVKFSPSASLIACLRVLIVANDGRALPVDTSMTAESLDATVERVRYIQCSEECKEYLTKLGGYDYTKTNDWARTTDFRPGKISRHVAWLIKNRKVNLVGKRFLVESVKTEWHNSLLMSSVRATVIDGLFKGIISSEAACFVVVEKDFIYLCVPEFHKRYSILTGSSKLPEAFEIADHFTQATKVVAHERKYFNGSQKRALKITVASLLEAGKTVNTDYYDEVVSRLKNARPDIL
jgi:hypothetical protein